MAKAEDDPVIVGPTAAAEIARLRDGVDAALASTRQLNAELAGGSRLGQQFARTLGTAFIGVALQGKSLGDVLRGLALSLSRLALGAAFKPLEGAIGNAFGSLVAAPPLFSAAGSVAAPASLKSVAGLASAAAIAKPAAGSGAHGAASPGPPAASGAPSIVLHVTTPDADSFRRSETQLAAMLARVVGQGQRNL